MPDCPLCGATVIWSLAKGFVCQKDLSRHIYDMDGDDYRALCGEEGEIMNGDVEVLSGWEVRCNMCCNWTSLICRIRVRNGKIKLAAVCGNQNCGSTVHNPWRSLWPNAVDAFKVMKIR